MHGLALFLALISVHLHCFDGFKCKTGDAEHGLGMWFGSSKDEKVEECKKGAHYCAAATCTRAGRFGFGKILWWCEAATGSPEECAEHFRARFDKITLLKGLSCECHFGERDQNMGNEQFTLPPIPKGLMCKLGDFDANGIGGLLEGKCFHDDHYCFIARCYKGNEFFKTEWGCAANKSVDGINGQIGEVANATVDCRAKFGEWNVDFSNENFTNAMLDDEMSSMTTTTPTISSTPSTSKSTLSEKIRTTAAEPTTIDLIWGTSKSTLSEKIRTTAAEPTTIGNSACDYPSLSFLKLISISCLILTAILGIFIGWHFNTV